MTLSVIKLEMSSESVVNNTIIQYQKDAVRITFDLYLQLT